MNLLRITVFSIGMVVFSGLFNGANAQQLCGYCSDGYDGELGAEVHEFSGTGAILSCNPGSFGCHYYPAFDRCTDYHGVCQYGATEIVDSLAVALASRSSAEIDAVMQMHGDRIRVTEHAFYVTECRGGAVTILRRI